MYTLTLILLAVFCLYIGTAALSSWDADFLLSLDTVPVRVLFVLVFTVFLCALIIIICRTVKRLSERALSRTALACIIVIAAGQLIFLAVIQPQLRYDPLKIFDMALEMLETHTISGTYEDGYFARYTNNYPLTIITYGLFCLLSKVSVPESLFMTVVQVLNVGCITLSVWLGYLIVKELRGGRTAVAFLCVCVICPLSYVWAGYYYTATVSMPFLMAVLYLWIILKKEIASENRRLWKCVLLCALMGFCLIFGYKIRATAAIAFIAVVIDALLLLRRRRGDIKNYIKNIDKPGFLALVRALAAQTVSFMLTAGLTLGMFAAAVDTYVDFDYENTGFPMVHWVMMGARWDGAYDMSDENYTSGFDTKEEKIAADLEVLQERISDAGPYGLLTLSGRKLLNTWVDGTDDFKAENSYASYTKVYDYLIGDKSGFLTVYSQSFRALQMLAAAAAAVYSLYALKKKAEKPKIFLVRLTFLGGMAFHLIWETNPLYSISFTFLGLIILTDALYSFTESRIYIKMSAKSEFITVPCMAVLAVLLILSEKQLVETPIEGYDYSVDQYQYAGGYDGVISSYDQNYVQSFTTDKPFNRISILGVNDVGGYNQSAFCVKLTDEYGTVLYDSTFATGLLVSLRDYEFEVGEIVPDGETTYYFEISPGYFKDEDSLELLSYTTGNWDLYTGGSLSVAGVERENVDLVFAVYEYEVTTYFSLKQYTVICAGMLLICGAVCILIRRDRHRNS